MSHGTHSGTQSFFFNPGEATTGRLLSEQILFRETIRNEIHEVKVPVTTLDAHFSAAAVNYAQDSQLYEITLLKTDTEGYDTLVLLGGKETLKKTGMVIFECHLLEDAEQGGPGTTHYQAGKFLEALDFRVFKIGRNTLLEFTSSLYNSLIDINKAWSNCLALRKGHPWELMIYERYGLIGCPFSED